MFEFAFFGIIFFNGKRWNEINNFLFLFDGIDPPVVDDEFQLIDFSVTISDLSISVEGLTHDSNEHVK